MPAAVGRQRIYKVIIIADTQKIFLNFSCVDVVREENVKIEAKVQGDNKTQIRKIKVCSFYIRLLECSSECEWKKKTGK